MPIRLMMLMVMFGAGVCSAVPSQYEQLRQDYQQLQENYQHLQKKYRNLQVANCNALGELDRLTAQVIEPYLAEAKEKLDDVRKTNCALLDEIDRLKVELAQSKYKAQENEAHYKKEYNKWSIERKILDDQLRDLRSFQGWLTHTKGASVWLCIALCGAAYKKGLFDWVLRYEQKVVQAVRAHKNKMRQVLLKYVASTKH